MIDYDEKAELGDVYCDYPRGCDETLQRVEGESWQDIIGEAKDAGWKIIRINSEWYHLCPHHQAPEYVIKIRRAEAGK